MAGFASKQEMEKVISKFIDLMTKTPALSIRSKGVKVSIGYEITDLDLKFHTEFMDGVVTGGLGEATPASMVILETDSETFDGMMGGELDMTSVVMSGQVSISGDMTAAMGLQGVNDVMMDLYKQARGA